MAVRPTDPEALHLFQLIGAPLLAVVQAEAQAAQVSADFIKRIGFEMPEPAGPAAAAATSGATAAAGQTGAAQPAAPAQPGAATPVPRAEVKWLQEGGELGNLRIAEFRIDRYAQDGTPQPHVVRVPVLSLFPVPLLQVKEATFDFDIHVLSRVPMGDAREDKQDHPPLSQDYLSKDRVELKGFLASSRGGGGGEAVTDASIKVRVRMEQSDMPAGLIHLMNIMGENITVAPLTLIEQGKEKAKDKPAPGR